MALQRPKIEYESDFCVKYEDFNSIFRDRGSNGWRLRKVLPNRKLDEVSVGVFQEKDAATLIWERDGAGVVDHAMIQDPCQHYEFILNSKIQTWACKECGEPMDRCLDEMQVKR